MLRWFLFLTVCALASPRSAEARGDELFSYPYAQVWSAAVRLVRVDLRFAVEERDPKMGFVLFKYRDQKREYPASIELLEDKKGSGRTKVVVQVPGMPGYVENMILSQFRKKLRADYGLPLSRPRLLEENEKSRQEAFDSAEQDSSMRGRDTDGSKVRRDERRESGEDKESR